VIIAPEETLAELAMAAGAGVTKILPCFLDPAAPAMPAA